MEISDCRFLVVDKTPYACQTVKSLLWQLGAAKTKYVTEVDDALSLIHTGKVDLLLFEPHLKEESGFDLLRAVRIHEDERIKVMPAIMIITNADKKTIAKGRDLGVDEIIAKPFPANVLQARLDAVVNNRRAFVEQAVYTGPDRRRHDPKEFSGQDRREGD
jgi:DNA-binding response OmpR family regulator